MSTSTLGSSKSLNGKTIGIAVAAGVLVLAIIGWAAGWFGGTPEQAAAPAVTTEQPAAPAVAAPQPAAPATQQ
jgi:hypothetical protein